jgi:hypothetical protein
VLSGSVKVVSKKDFYAGSPLSALFEEFETPGITVFAKSSNSSVKIRQSSFLSIAGLVFFVILLNQ